MAATLVGAVSWRNGGSTTLPLSMPSGLTTGDLIMVEVQVGTNIRDITDWSAKGWWLHVDTIINTREVFIFSRIYNSNDAASVYTLTMDGTGAGSGVSAAVRGHGVIDQSDIRMGAIWTRGANGGAQKLINAPSVSASQAGSYALAFYGYANSNATVMTPGGAFSLLAERKYDPSPEWPSVFGFAMASAGDAGDQTWTSDESITNINGLGVQFMIPPLVSSIQTYVSDSFTRTNGSTWGTPDTGPTWTASGNSSHISVSNGKGIINNPPTLTTSLINPLSPTQTDLQIQFEFQFDQIPVGGNMGYRTFVRYIDVTNNYHLRVTIAPDASASLQFARGDIATVGSAYSWGTISANTTYKMKVKILGVSPTVMKGKLWALSDSEPTWQVIVSDTTAGYQVAGATGLRHSTSPGVTNGAFYATFDNYLVTNGPEPVTTASIGAHASFSPDATSITVGFHKTRGTTAEVSLRDTNGGELARQTATVNATTGWGNTVFTGLAAATAYNARFIIDGALQTDAQLNIKTLPAATATSYVAIAGSCQFTASNHAVWDNITAENPIFLAHMGDLHYDDATTEPSWRSAIQSSMTTARFKALLENVPFHWSMDNHDRIITNTGGVGTTLNLGTTDLATAATWKYLAGSSGWATSDTLGRTWVAGRVRYIQADMWSVRQDPDFDTGTLSFLGAAQKQWWKDTLSAATEPIIVWFCNWTTLNNGNGRWNSFPNETTELENWLVANPNIRRRMVLIGGDSHSLQADSGTRTGNYRFKGIPSLNMSGFNRSGTAGDGSAGWDIANTATQLDGTEANWGNYSRITVTDSGKELRFKWEAISVNVSGVATTKAWFERSFGQQAIDNILVGSTQVDAFYVGSDLIWRKDTKGSNL